MSKENLEQFIQQISDSEELQSTIGDEIDTDAFIALGAQHGCDFSVEDLAENAELSDEELDGVAGGVSILGQANGVKFRIAVVTGISLADTVGDNNNVREPVRKNAERLKR